MMELEIDSRINCSFSVSLILIRSTIAVTYSPHLVFVILTLTESIAWVEDIIKFLDDTYKEYVLARFGKRKAWHISTRLAKYLVEEVAQPRNSLQNTFKAGNPNQIAKVMFYSTLKSLDLIHSSFKRYHEQYGKGIQTHISND